MKDDALLIEDYLQQRRDAISNYQVSYHQNQIEIFKHLFTLAVAAFGYHLLNIDKTENIWVSALGISAGLLLGFTIALCFFIFHTLSKIQVLMIESRKSELNRDKDEDKELKGHIESAIKRLNDSKMAAFMCFTLSIFIIYFQHIYI